MSELRTNQINVRVNDNECEMLEYISEYYGMNRAEVIRSLFKQCYKTLKMKEKKR